MVESLRGLIRPYDEFDALFPGVLDARLKAVAKKIESNWTPSQIIEDLEAGASLLLSVENGTDRNIGIAIIYDDRDPYTNELGALVQIAHADHGVPFLEYLDTMWPKFGKFFGYSFIRFVSPRKGWLRKPAFSGWGIENYIFRRDLIDGR